MPTRAVAVIPARYLASRFPGKLLAELAGRPVLAHVVTHAREASRVSRVVVATDDERLGRVASEAGAEVVLTEGEHATGSDRVGEAVRRLRLDASVVVNVQGDEPFLGPEAIDRCVAALDADPDLDLATLATSCTEEDAQRTQVVKVVTGDAGRALYFSRAPIPWSEGEVSRLKHIGVYAFRPGALMRFLSHPGGRLEASERLEQLRALEMGMTIGVVEGAFSTIGIDTPDDLARARERFRAGS
jgi:3-deoxy-manno-octulosonate cytidylyltransferase (CMP-KDO synthetase)